MTPVLRSHGVRILLVLGLGVGLSLLLVHAGSVVAQGSWLDQPLVNWNQPGMAIPAAPAAMFDNPQCLQTTRPPQTDEDSAVAAAGWMLVGSFQGGWGVMVVTGTSDFDGMCRPIGYQVFVFENGSFAGTISPETMADRFDGAAGDIRLTGGSLSGSGATEITAAFSRYSPTDPLCCPSAISSVTYSVDVVPGGPVLTPRDVSTNPTSGG